MPMTSADGGSSSQVDPSTLSALQNLMSQYQGTAGAQTNNNEPMVYFGGADSFQGDHQAQAYKTLSLTAAQQNFFAWSPSEQQAWANKMYRAGLINDPGNMDAALAQWSSAVEFAANQFTYGAKKVTPWDVMQDRLGLSKLAGNSNGPRTTTSTSTRLQVLTNGDADSLITAIFQNQLGRDPNKGELARYRSMLINKVKENPETSTTTTTTDAQGNSTSNTSSAGGVSQGELQSMVQEPVNADPEWGAYQAATTYMGALEGLLGGSPDLTG